MIKSLHCIVGILLEFRIKMPQRRDSAGAVCNSVMGMLLFFVEGGQCIRKKDGSGAQFFLFYFLFLHENVVFSFCARMGNAMYIICIMWNSISSFDI